MNRSTHEESSQARAEARVNLKLEKNLATYVVAAGAAGVGLMALSQPAEGKIIYTPANIVINTSVPIDFDHNGTTDVWVSYFNQVYGWGVQAYPAAGNAVRRTANSLAAPVFFGAQIGPNGVFGAGEAFVLASCFAKSNFSTCGGPWDNIGTRYLGVQFQIAGQAHFGWVRIKMVGVSGTITGYAYETTPQKAIRAGYLHPTVKSAALEQVPAAPQLASLGALALGASGLSVWRRDEEAQPV